MKIEKNKLLQALDTVKAGLSNNEVIEQSTSFCFLDGQVVTYNDEISISCPTEVALTGAVSSKELHNVLKKVNGTEIEISLDENHTEIQIKAGKTKAGLRIQKEVILPLSEIGKPKEWQEIPNNFIQALQMCKGVVGDDFAMPTMTCVHIKGAIMEATDRYRVINYTLESEFPFETLLSKKVTNPICAFNPVMVAEGAGWVHFKNADEAVLSCRVFEGAFPNTAPIIEKTGVEISMPDDLPEILERMNVFTTAYNDYVDIRMEKNKITFKRATDTAWIQEVSKNKTTQSEPIEFSIMYYLIQGIAKQNFTTQKNDTFLIFIGADFKYISMLKVS